MTPDKLRKPLRQGQQLLADITVQLAAIHIRRNLRARGISVRRGFASASYRRAATALSSAVFAPAALRSSAPTRRPLAILAALRNPLPRRATARHLAPAMVTVAVRISGRVRSG
ncbi:MAG: hypothetical protein M3Y48_24475 [Actinomycetota bacterium]|nr:hypothetical protein [Actinomycetota bacterium]